MAVSANVAHPPPPLTWKATPSPAAADLPLPELDGVVHRYVWVDGLRLHYAEAGRGEPLILLHGWPQHWWSWRELIGPLAERYRVICPDVRGLGWSTTPADNYSFPRLARDVVDLMDQLGIAQARMVGHDWGNVTGYQVCLTWPERFHQYVGLGGVHPWAAKGSPLPVYVRPWHIYFLAALRGFGMHQVDVPAHCLRTWRHRGRFSDRELAVYLDAIRRPAAVNATWRFDRNVVLHEISHFARHYRLLHQRVPTLHLNGEHDPLTRRLPHSYRDFADEMVMELVPDCGHFIPEERPDWLVGRLNRFLT